MHFFFYAIWLKWRPLGFLQLRNVTVLLKGNKDFFFANRNTLGQADLKCSLSLFITRTLFAATCRLIQLTKCSFLALLSLHVCFRIFLFSFSVWEKGNFCKPTGVWDVEKPVKKCTKPRDKNTWKKGEKKDAKRFNYIHVLVNIFLGKGGKRKKNTNEEERLKCIATRKGLNLWGEKKG